MIATECDALVLYIPVVHAGHLKLFDKYKGVDLYVLGQQYVDEFSGRHQEIRAVSPENVSKMLDNLHFFSSVQVLDQSNMDLLRERQIVTVDDRISREFTQKYFQAEHVTIEQVFLRWDENSVQKPHAVRYDRVSRDSFDRLMIARAKNEADKSSDWWRHVGAVLVYQQQVVLEAHNEHMPSEYTQYIDGDPRDYIEAGKLGQISSVIHAEQLIVAEAAKRRIGLDGLDIFMNIFPCNTCARLVIRSGIKKCYFEEGNAYLKVEEEFAAGGVEIIHVE